KEKFTARLYPISNRREGLGAGSGSRPGVHPAKGGALIVRIRRLGHIALTTPDLARAEEFYRQIVGLVVSGREDGAVYMKCNELHHSLVLYEGEQAGVHHLGLEVATEEDVRAAAVTLQEKGVAIIEENPRERGQGPAIRFRDPSGFTLEIYAGMERVAP